MDADPRTFWVCGRVIGENIEDAFSWALRGTFDGEAEARLACKDDYDFVAPYEHNVSHDFDIQSWPGLYYPISDL